jgi:hypothetical protein
MVHALHEAQRVLKPDGILIDLRPKAVHRRVGIARAGIIQPVGSMREKFDDDLAADRAVAQVLRDGLFKIEKRLEFNCNRTMDSYNEFRDWLNEFAFLGNMPPHDWLLERVKRALAGKTGKYKMVAGGPLKLQVLRKPAVRQVMNY